MKPVRVRKRTKVCVRGRWEIRASAHH